MKKIIVLILIVLMCMNTTAFAYSDITDPTVPPLLEPLIEFKILNGYEDGTFRPHNNITRAEFAKIITIAMRLENVMPSVDDEFEDVPDDAWYKEYVYITKTMGIINGTSNTTFSPNDSITFEQAIKMIVIALGYEQEAREYGGYPNGYLTVAQNLNITENMYFEATDFANRLNVACLIHNALFTPCYYLTFDGENIERIKSDKTLFELHSATSEISRQIENENSENIEETEIDSVG